MPNNLTRDELMRNYWRYYLVLESKFTQTLNYVELDETNYNTYSHEFAMLQQAVGAELDNFFKIYCGFNTSDNKSIFDYAEQILSGYPNITKQKLYLKGYGGVIVPFADWNADQPGKSLFWWSAFTRIKHNRGAEYREANLKNVLHILGALYILEMKYLSKVINIERGVPEEPDVPDKESSIFEPLDWKYRYIPCGNGVSLIDGKFYMTYNA